jgi:hypothetical protein
MPIIAAVVNPMVAMIEMSTECLLSGHSRESGIQGKNGFRVKPGMTLKGRD